MLNFLKKKSGIVAPVEGECLPITEVDDKVFSTKMMGDGFAIIPEGDTIVSPMDGEIVTIPSSKHAIGLRSREGIEILIHIGLDTVMLQGKGFTVLCKEGTKVKAGAPLIKIDTDFMKEKGIDLTTMIVFTSGYTKEIKLDCFHKKVKCGDLLIQ